jgi:hypothetical protein
LFLRRFCFLQPLRWPTTGTCRGGGPDLQFGGHPACPALQPPALGPRPRLSRCRGMPSRWLPLDYGRDGPWFILSRGSEDPRNCAPPRAAAYPGNVRKAAVRPCEGCQAGWVTAALLRKVERARALANQTAGSLLPSTGDSNEPRTQPLMAALPLARFGHQVGKILQVRV